MVAKGRWGERTIAGVYLPPTGSSPSTCRALWENGNNPRGNASNLGTPRSKVMAGDEAAVMSEVSQMPEELDWEKIRAAINEAVKIIAQSDQTIARAQQAIDANREILKQHAERDTSGTATEHHAPAD